MTSQNRLRRSKVFIGFASALFFGLSFVVAAAPQNVAATGPTINQGTTSTYGVLAASTVTNTGATTISGTAGSNIGLSPGTSYTNTGSVTIGSGATNITNSAASIAQSDLVTAYNDLSIPTAATLTNLDLGGQTLTPGAYVSGSSLANSTNLTFDALGDSTAIFIIKAVSTVITSSASTMTLTNGAQACNIYWQVGSSATLGTNSTFIGHVYALTSITATTGATIYGQLLARNAAVTLDNNTIVNNACTTPVVTTTTTQVAATTSTAPKTTTTAPKTTTTAPKTATTAPKSSTTTPKTATTTPVSAKTTVPRPQLPNTGTNTGQLALIVAAVGALGAIAYVLRRRALSKQ